MSESTVSLRAIIKNEVSAALREISEDAKTVEKSVAAVDSTFKAASESALQLVNSSTGISGSFKSAIESSSAFTGGIRSLAEAENALFVSAQNAIVALKAQKSASADLGYQALQAEIKSLSAASATAIPAAKTLSQSISDAGNHFRSASESAAAYTSGIRSVSEAYSSLHTAAQNQIADLKAQKMALQDAGYKQAQAEIKALNAELNPEPVQSFSQKWQGLASQYYLVSQAAGIAKAGIMSLVDAASKYELLHARLNAVEGSEALGNRDFATVQEMAKKPGLGFEEAASTMATLRGMKVTANEAKQLINGIAQANASAAGTAEQFGRVMYQIQQSVSLGRLMAEDLRPIMQAIPTLGAAIQEHFGASQAEALNDKLKASGKSVREFWLEVSELGQKLPSTGETITNNLDNISDAWIRLRASVSDTEFFKTATGALAAFLDGMAAKIEQKSDEASYVQQARRTLGKQGFVRSLLYGDQGAGEDDVQKEAARLKAFDLSQATVLGAIKAAQEEKDRAANEAARKKEEEDKKRSDAAKKARETEAKRLQAERIREQKDADDSFRSATGVSYGAYSVAHPGSVEPDAPGRGSSLTKSMVEKDEKLRQKLADVNEKFTKQEEKTKKAHLKVEAVEFAVTERRKSDTLKEELDRRKAMYDKYAGQVQGLAQSQLAAGLRGEFSLTEARRAAFETSTNMAAQWVTESIATYIKKSIFEKEQMAVDAAAAEAAQAVTLAASIGAATKTTAAWAPAALAVTAATFGANATAGMAQYALLQTQVLGGALMPHARGGSIFGPALASREEAFIPLVPGRVVPSHNSTINNNSTTNATNHFHFHGSDEKTILRTLRKAGIDNRKVSRT